MTDGFEDGDRLWVVLAVVLVSIGVGGTVDLMLGQPQHWLGLHVVF